MSSHQRPVPWQNIPYYALPNVLKYESNTPSHFRYIRLGMPRYTPRFVIDQVYREWVRLYRPIIFPRSFAEETEGRDPGLAELWYDDEEKCFKMYQPSDIRSGREGRDVMMSGGLGPRRK